MQNGARGAAAQMGAIGMGREIRRIQMHQRVFQHHGVGPSKDASHLRADALGMIPLVIVPLGAVVPCGQLQRNVACSPECASRVGWQAPIDDAMVPLVVGQDRRIVLLAVVHDDQLFVGPGLSNEALDRTSRQARAVARHHQAADAGGSGRSSQLIAPHLRESRRNASSRNVNAMLRRFHAITRSPHSSSTGDVLDSP
jgi:hypothetical protein